MRLSLITIALDDPKGLEKTIASASPLSELLLNQFEHLIIDSSPSAHQGVRNNFHSLKYLRWVETPPSGIYPAINEGTGRALGDIIWHLHSGDFITDPHLAIMALAKLEASDADFLISPVELERNGQFMFVRHHSAELKRNLLGLSSIHHQGVLFKKSVFMKIGLFNPKYSISGDYDFFIRVANGNCRHILFERPFVRYDTGGRSLTQFKILFEECNLIRHQLKMSPMEKVLSFCCFNYHRFRVAILTPLLEALGLYDCMRKLFYFFKGSSTLYKR